MEKRIYADKTLQLQEVEEILRDWLGKYPKPLKKVLIIPPDGTRAHSLAGPITNMLYKLLQPGEVKILPALGTHFPMSLEEKQAFFGPDIPFDCFLDHNWRSDVTTVGVIPAQFIKEVSAGLVDFSIQVDVNQELLTGGYDLILSVGQVVPHEVVGMANYTKNVVVGCGGKDIIDKSHFLGAVYGMESLMGRDHSPVRKVFDYAEREFLKDLPLAYILTVTKTDAGTTSLEGLYIGNERDVFEQAVRKSQVCNLDLLQKRPKKVVVYLDPQEFKSTWLGNKAIYRTRMAIATGGELLILAPGVKSFGEDPEIDRLIRRYGYGGRDPILKQVEQEPELAGNLSVAAHLIHGSADGRFRVTYAMQHLNEEEITGVNFGYMPFAEAVASYDPNKLEAGFNVVNGEEIFFIPNPALGLWAMEKDFI